MSCASANVLVRAEYPSCFAPFPLLGLAVPSPPLASVHSHEDDAVRAAGACRTRKQGTERHLLCIEDPFETSHDLGRTVGPDGLTLLRREFERAAGIFASSSDVAPKLFMKVRSCLHRAVGAAGCSSRMQQARPMPAACGWGWSRGFAAGARARVRVGPAAQTPARLPIHTPPRRGPAGGSALYRGGQEHRLRHASCAARASAPEWTGTGTAGPWRWPRQGGCGCVRGPILRGIGTGVCGSRGRGGDGGGGAWGLGFRVSRAAGPRVTTAVAHARARRLKGRQRWAPGVSARLNCCARSRHPLSSRRVRRWEEPTRRW